MKKEQFKITPLPTVLISNIIQVAAEEEKTLKQVQIIATVKENPAKIDFILTSRGIELTVDFILNQQPIKFCINSNKNLYETIKKDYESQYSQIRPYLESVIFQLFEKENYKIGVPFLTLITIIDHVFYDNSRRIAAPLHFMKAIKEYIEKFYTFSEALLPTYIKAFAELLHRSPIDFLRSLSLSTQLIRHAADLENNLSDFLVIADNFPELKIDLNTPKYFFDYCEKDLITPLGYAISGENLEAVKKLLALGANPQAPVTEEKFMGSTPLLKVLLLIQSDQQIAIMREILAKDIDLAQEFERRGSSVYYEEFKHQGVHALYYAFHCNKEVFGEFMEYFLSSKLSHAHKYKILLNSLHQYLQTSASLLKNDTQTKQRVEQIITKIRTIAAVDKDLFSTILNQFPARLKNIFSKEEVQSSVVEALKNLSFTLTRSPPATNETPKPKDEHYVLHVLMTRF